MNEKLHSILAQLRNRLESVYDERFVRMLVYGSQVRGDASRWSDIDVAVVLQGQVDCYEELHRTEELVAELSLEFDTVIHCKFIDEDSFGRGDRPLLRSIQREGIAV